jgi:hypothetical protein
MILQKVLLASTLSAGLATAAMTQEAAAPQQLANPAAAFCVESGGTYKTVEEAAGQRGICVLPDGREVDAWAHFREKHSALPSSDASRVLADKIWSGGPILTMNDDAMRAEAVAEKDGVIIAVGEAAEVMAHKGPETEMIDLAGQTLIPGFVDAHGHVFMVGIQALSANLPSAPDGTVNDIPALQEVMRAYSTEYAERVRNAGFLLGFEYDDAQLAELRHPTRDDLDAISTEMPIYILHQSGHLGVANSRALELAGITADTPDPVGGVIRRKPGSSEPNGVMEENASIMTLMAVFGNLDEKAGHAIFQAGADLVASYGYTTAQEGRSTPVVAEVMRKVAKEDGLDIDVVTYPDVLADRDYILANASRAYVDRFRVGGAKLTIDGSPQGFTALRDRPYYDPPEGFRADYKGYSAATPDQVFDSIDWAYANNVQILTHSNGEGASDMLIAAISAATKAHGPADRRPVLIHGQFLRSDQVAAFDRLDVFPSLFPMHTFYWGDWHRDRTVGPENADNISPTGWVRERGMMFSSHHDAPVAFPDAMRVLDATVTRRSRSGDIIGPHQRVDVLTALKALTIWPAYQHFEEATKGSLEPGKLADLVILTQDPTAIDPETLDTIKVAETIKEGETIYNGDTRQGRLEYRPMLNGGDPYADFVRVLAASHHDGDAEGHGLTDSLHAHAPGSDACVAEAFAEILTAGLVKNGAAEGGSLKN